MQRRMVLSKGSHQTKTEGLCAAEAVALIGGEPHSDHPKCLSPVLGEAIRWINDVMDDEARQLLIALIPDLIDTNDPALERQRAILLAQEILHLTRGNMPHALAEAVSNETIYGGPSEITTTALTWFDHVVVGARLQGLEGAFWPEIVLVLSRAAAIGKDP